MLKKVASFALALVAGLVLVTFASDLFRDFAVWIQKTFSSPTAVVEIWASQVAAYAVLALIVGVVVRTLNDTPSLSWKTYLNGGLLAVSIILGFAGMFMLETKFGEMTVLLVPVPLRTLFGNVPEGINAGQLYAFFCALVGTLFLK